MKGYVLLLMISVCMTFPGRSAIAQQGGPSSESSLDLTYYSDYFSFAGRDDQGYVAFAIDNNRGKDGDTYQAEHFLVLHDEQEGWVGLLGNGGYENRNKELERIPDSPYFKFSGSATQGFIIESRQNDLALRIGKMVTRISRSGKGGLYERWAPLMLCWSGRAEP